MARNGPHNNRFPGRKAIKYSRKVGRRVCRLIAKSDKGLDYHYCRKEWFPHPMRVQKWIHNHEEFRDLYFIAKAVQAHRMATQQTEIADDFAKLCRKNRTIHPARLNALAQAVKMQIESRRWAAARLSPRDWGDKFDIQAKVDTPSGSIDRLADELASIASRAQAEESD